MLQIHNRPAQHCRDRDSGQHDLVRVSPPGGQDQKGQGSVDNKDESQHRGQFAIEPPREQQGTEHDQGIGGAVQPDVSQQRPLQLRKVSQPKGQPAVNGRHQSKTDDHRPDRQNDGYTRPPGSRPRVSPSSGFSQNKRFRRLPQKVVP